MINQSLSLKDFAEIIGVSESSLRRWVDKGILHVARTGGGHRRIPLNEAIRFIRETEITVVRPDLIGLPDLADTPAAQDESHEDVLALFVDALMQGREAEARGIVLSKFVAGRSIAHVCDQFIQPAMSAIGSLWQHGDRGIFIEHRAADICAQAINQVRTILPTPKDDAPVAFGAAPSNDPYQLPAMAAAAVLAEHHWHAINLGPNMPCRVLAEFAQEQEVKLVWLALSLTEPGLRLDAEIADLARQMEQSGTHLVIGGRGVEQLPNKLPKNVVPLASMSELSAYVRTIARD